MALQNWSPKVVSEVVSGFLTIFRFTVLVSESILETTLETSTVIV
jgi:hypothetical protein